MLYDCEVTCVFYCLTLRKTLIISTFVTVIHTLLQIYHYRIQPLNFLYRVVRDIVIMAFVKSAVVVIVAAGWVQPPAHRAVESHRAAESCCGEGDTVSVELSNMRFV